MTLYHVSPKYLGKAPILTPRIPEGTMVVQVKL
jgi:hypothetical protein